MSHSLKFAVALTGLLVCLPGATGSPVGGTPLAFSGFALLGLVFCAGTVPLFFPLRRPPGRWLVIALLVLAALKVTALRDDAASGWRAAYRYGDTTGKMHDASFYWRFATWPYRIEEVIELRDTRSDLHFFNDVPLYGYPPYNTTPREELYPLDVTWTSHVDASAPRDLVWLVSGAGRVTIITPAGESVLDNPIDVRLDVTSGAGPQMFTVVYSKPAGTPPFVSVQLRDRTSGTRLATRALAGPAPSRFSAVATSAAVWSGVALLVGAIAVALMRSGTVVAEPALVTRAAGLAATIVLAGWAVVLAIGSYGSTAFLQPGGDPLIYGSSARDILHHGPLMLHGAPLGQATPFYFYPLYPYVLALGHALVGENMSSIYFVNGLLVALLPILFLALGWSRLPAVAGVVAFAALTSFLWLYGSLILTYDQPSFTDACYLTVVFMAVLALARAFAAPTPARLVLAGVLIALGAATRPSLMTLVYLAPGGLAWAMGFRSPKRWAIATAWLVAGVALGLLPFTLRNGIAAGRFVVLVNSWIQIPYFLVPPELPEKPGGVPGLIEALRMAWAIFLEHPMRTLRTEVRKILFTFGITASLPLLIQANELVVLPVLFGWTLIKRRLQGPTGVAVITFVVSHVLAMLVAAPWTFHYKSILPLHAAFLFGAAFLLDRRQSSAAPATGPPEPRAA